MAAAKRSRLEEERPKEEKDPKLKCHEMRLIFQRLPTSELIRFVSRQPKHPLGKFWSQELKFVVEKRLPFSFKATGIFRGTVSDHVIFDCNGNRVAQIKRPQHFRLSPICELIESAEVPVIAPIDSSWMPPQFVFPLPDILSTLTNLDTLVLSARDVTRHNLQDPVDLPAALNPAVISRIKSLTLTDLDYYGQFWKPILDIISRATSLKKLSVPYVGLTMLAALSPSVPGHYFGLESLSIKRLTVESVQPLLEIITSRFSGLCELFLPLRGAIREYLAAFQGLPSLATLGLGAHGFIGHAQAEKQWAVDERDAPVVSVTELLIGCWSLDEQETQALLAMLRKFPNVRTFSADVSWKVRDFASAVCAGGVFSHLQSLKLCSYSGSDSLSGDTLLQFIRSNFDHLPSSVELSHVKTDCPRNVDGDFLVEHCLALQGGRVTSLALKDLVHRDAVARLREKFALSKQDIPTPQTKVGKILAWIDEGSIDERRIHSRAAGWPLEVSDFTDFLIEACKTSGPLKGSSFRVRISAWT